MRYFITDQENKDWLGRLWGEQITHHEENPNYYFFTCDNPLVTLFMNPAYDQYQTPKLWLAEPTGDQAQVDFRYISTSLTTIRTISQTIPTIDQYITFGLVCALNVIANKTFTTWALNWLNNKDRSPETAKQVTENLLQEMLIDKISSSHAALASVTNQSILYAACTAHRAYHDSLTNDPLDLNQIATIVIMLPPEEIGVMLGENDGTTENNPGRETITSSLQNSGPNEERSTNHDNHHRTTSAGHGNVLPGSQNSPAPNPPDQCPGPVSGNAVHA